MIYLRLQYYFQVARIHCIIRSTRGFRGSSIDLGLMYANQQTSQIERNIYYWGFYSIPKRNVLNFMIKLCKGVQSPGVKLNTTYYKEF